MAGLLDKLHGYRIPDPIDVGRRLGLNVPTYEQMKTGLLGGANIVGPQADIKGIVNDSRASGEAFGRGDYLDALAKLGMAGAGIAMIPVPGTVAGIKEGVKRGLLGDAKTGNVKAGSGEPQPASSGVPVLSNTDSVPQPLPTYPPVVPPVFKQTQKELAKKKLGTSADKQYRWDEKVEAGEEYPATLVFPSKQNSPEALAISKQVTKAQKDIDAGNYTPMFDVSKRSDVNPKPYNIGSSTQIDSWAKKPETRATARLRAQHPDGIARLEDAFKEGTKIKNSNNWYYMRQLEEAFIKELGPDAGRKAFKEKFAQPMAATTGGAAPKENLRTAMYGNFLKENNIPYPENAYDMPFPAGGQYIAGNINMYKKFADKGIDTADPKRFNFQNNFLGEKSSATVDKQMSQLFDPKLQMPQGDSYGAYEEVVINLAKKHGVSPREFQEVAWAGAKKAREGARYPGSRPMIEEVNQAIERTSRVTGLTPKQVLTEGIIKSKIPIYGAVGLLGANAMMSDDEFN